MAPNLVRHLLFTLTLLVSGWLMLDDLDEKSPTEDEWAHLVRGLQLWHGEDTRLQYAHPPVANALMALPLALDDDIPDFTKLDGWSSATVGRVAFAWLQTDYEGARNKLLRARIASVALALLGLVYVYLWGSSFLGSWEGLSMAALLGLNPTVLGQARYVGTDVACAVFCFAAVGELARHLRGDSSVATWIGVPLTLSLAVLSKHSALLLVPIFLVFTAVMAANRRGRYVGHSLSRRLSSWAGYVVLNAVVAVAALNLAYSFQGSGMTVAQLLAFPEPEYWVSKPYGGLMLETTSPIRHLPMALPLPAPRTWIFGVSAVRLQSTLGYPWGSFLGLPNPRGHAGFFPLLLVLKTPLLWIVGATFAAGSSIRRRRIPPALGVAGATALGFLLAAMSSRLNMGIRHVLQVVYLGSPWVAVGLCKVWRWVQVTEARLGLLLLGAGSLLLPAIVHRADFLGYFNVGRGLGHRVSVVGEDIGQDRFRFARWADSVGLTPLFYDSQSPTRALEARWAGLQFFELDCATPLPRGAFVAVHVSRRMAIDDDCMSQLIELDPIDTFGDHIDVYRIPP